ncbi:hypothetical protein AcV7_001680 [Taiwanofungus camphoratus]|nr:hypothetical protein AcV7_001680 [Antrodia cinnamomea]
MAVVASSSTTYSALPSTSMNLSMKGVATHSAPSPLTNAQFAFASIKGNICLVQVSGPSPGKMSSALMASDVNVFRHEFITQFRYSHSASVHPADMHVLEPIDERCILYEEEKGTVFLARDVMARLQTLTMEVQRASNPYRLRGSGQVARLR